MPLFFIVLSKDKWPWHNIMPSKSKLNSIVDRSRIIIHLYDMSKLPIEKRTQIINLLVEGSSLQAASQISGCSINTVTKLLVDMGPACQLIRDEVV
jgi:hypothetical protein